MGSNFFYNVTLPVTLWFLDKSKNGTPREDQVLFLDARSIFTQIDRAHREFTPEQVQLLASIVRLYRGEDLNGFVFERENYTLPESQITALKAMFENKKYENIAGLSRAIKLNEIELQGWSLNPGRYVGVSEMGDENINFELKMKELNEELEQLNLIAHDLETTISKNIAELLNG